MKYHQITSQERYTLSALRTQGLNQAEIGRNLGRHRSTISRELARNSSYGDRAYRPSKADSRANGVRSRSRRNQRLTAQDFRLVERYLREKWSPEQISGRLRREKRLLISHETIYRRIWKDKKRGGDLYTHLRCAQKKRRKRRGSYDSRGRLPGKRHISERPAAVDARRTVGHWEGDTVVGVGSKDCIVTLAERKSGYAEIGKLKDRTVKATNRRTIELSRKHPGRFKTLTFDNGTEFHGYATIEKVTGATIYFATPYHSWERGSNENLNGLIRQYLPKKTNMADLTQSDCNAIRRNLNARPRKRLGYRTPQEAIDEA